MLKTSIADLPRTSAREERRARGGGLVPFLKKITPAMGAAAKMYAPELAPFIDMGEYAVQSLKSVDPYSANAV